ncbi:MAG: hypothetical protein IPK07_21490 [Deltaproteobacteria bacterium]|nr:hypothetical protein [Deltaproteobacteria bacterium]
MASAPAIRRAATLIGVAGLLALAACSSGESRGAAFVPTDPSGAGRFAVEHGTATLDVPEFRTYPALTYMPVADDAAAAEPPARVPGIVLSNGLAASGSIMSCISDHLGSHGYAVLTFTPANTLSLDMAAWARGFERGIDALLGESGGDAGALAGRVDPEHIGLVALSAGAAGAIEAAAVDPRVRAVVAFAPGINDLGRFLFQDTLDAAARVTAPTQIQVGTEDCLVNPRPPSLLAFTNLGRGGVDLYYDAIPAERQLLEITGANHIGYFDEAALGLWTAAIVDAIPIDCAATLPAAAQHTVAKRYATMWLDTFLYENPAWQDGLFGGGIEADLASDVLSRVRSDPPSG